MSDEEELKSNGDVGSDDDVINNGLIATRAKRATAGNLYASLRANLDDEELQRELLAEDEEDEGDYRESNSDDDDEALESSSDDDDDAGPPQEGDPEDLQGEKELKRVERAEAQKKRKALDARLKIPAFAKKQKKVRLADDAKATDAAPKTKKKSERANWLPSPTDAPVRQSGRTLAVANREVIHAHLKESLARSEKQRRVMKRAAERDRFKKRAQLTQEQRLEACARIAKQTEKEFGRWEREEEERQRQREAYLAAKRRRGFDGPFVRQWRGSVLWIGNEIKIKRIAHGSKKIEELVADLPISQRPPPPPPTWMAPPLHSQYGGSAAAVHPALPVSHAASPWRPQPPQAMSEQGGVAYTWPGQPQGEANTQRPGQPPAYAQTALPPAAPLPQTGWMQQRNQYPVYVPQSIAPPAPLIKEQAQRSLVMLEGFANLNGTNTRRARNATALDPTETAKILLPDACPSFTADEARYLNAKHRRGMYPPPPTKTRCVVIPHEPARYRDPNSGLPYCDRQTFRILQNAIGGRYQWSSLLGAWVGNRYGNYGAPAKGVPPGFTGRGNSGAFGSLP
ncbi:hypothetical protein K470DRAFT_10331 [Piedraia hortae CBS 480.64]|uniref:Vps72/YL1 C-terminal domain-containing protein n=1 Tax=Piedraia hortae CBS 480.64 TaxID=1314780 RepID=A0A6A7C5V5_9PEZI|nr:hypothetical protein K470DRAFT_10331 [Piedraia hortae CBS 480.64]